MDGFRGGREGQTRAVTGTLGITLLCFGRLKGSQCDLKEWPESSDDLGSLSQEGLHLEARARGTATCPHTMLPVSAILGWVIGDPLAVAVPGSSSGFSFRGLLPHCDPSQGQHSVGLLLDPSLSPLLLVFQQVRHWGG